jgi:hypothetical protein
VGKTLQTDAWLQRTKAARDGVFSAWGALEPARRKAGRPGLRVARQRAATLVASDGLADPDGRVDQNGLGLEVFAISRAQESVPGSWLGDLVRAVSQQAVRHAGLGPLLHDLGALTVELYDVRIPAEHRTRFVTHEARVCVLLGLTDVELPEVVEGPLASIRLVNVKLLTVDELAFVLQGGNAARRVLMTRLRQQGDVLASSLERESVAKRG